MIEEGTVTIFRLDPGKDKEVRYESYRIPYAFWYNVKVIDTLRYIYENLATDLCFREPCRQQVCGACLVLVNKKRVLACDVFSTKNMVIEPLPGHRVIKDLVVDFEHIKESAATLYHNGPCMGNADKF
jgi:succinate dehydrogenase/fumarate reductase iron-sulfur protein